MSLSQIHGSMKLWSCRAAVHLLCVLYVTTPDRAASTSTEDRQHKPHVWLQNGSIKLSPHPKDQSYIICTPLCLHPRQLPLFNADNMNGSVHSTYQQLNLLALCFSFHLQLDRLDAIASMVLYFCHYLHKVFLNESGLANFNHNALHHRCTNFSRITALQRVG